MTNIQAIKLQNVSKKYQLLHYKPTLIERLTGASRTETFWALKDLNLSIKAGEKIGLIGPNGAGKTTLLKIIAGITSPTKGVVTVNGRVVSLIDLAAGFHPDMSGEENIYLNGMLIGMTKSEITTVKKSIIRFADLHQFISSPVHTYSSGMQLRLGFAIAIHADPDILLMDEGYMVGDQNFQDKSLALIAKISQQKKLTMLFASHWREFLETNCDRIIEFNNGKIARSYRASHDRKSK